MRPTIRQLEYLIAVGETLHFGRAAERTHVSQPGLSAQIAELERILGVRLFERDRRRVLATPAGSEAVSRARLILAGVDALGESLARHGRPLTGTLRMGVIPTVAPYLLPRVMPAVRERFPELRLLIREDHTDRLLEMLEAGELDVLVLALEADLGDVHTLALFEDPFTLVVGPDHPLSRRKRAKLDDLDTAEVLLLEDGH